MSWNHRIVKHINTRKLKGQRKSYVWLGVHEVYYNTKGVPDALTVDAVGIVGSNMMELSETLGRFARAFTKPVLVYDHKADKFVEGDA